MKPNWFVGLVVDAHGWLPDLLTDLPDRVRAFHPDDVHITVAFLGACGEEAARRAWATAAHFEGAPVQVALGGLKPFGNPKRPSALSVVLDEGAEACATIIASLRDPMTEAAGARRDGRPPRPHITVARPARKARSEERRRAVEWAMSKEPLNVRLTLDTLALYTWSEDRRTRQFRIVESRLLEP